MRKLWKSAWVASPRRELTGVLLGLILLLQPGAAEPSTLILALGDDSYIPAEGVRAWTGAEVEKDLGERDPLEFAAVILSNIPYDGLPAVVQERLSEFVRQGGSLLITGGSNAYGSGGYQAVASLLPFEIRADDDWTAVPFKPVIALQPGNPILQGVTFRTVGTFNDLSPKPGAVEIAQYAGGVLYPSPLIAEQQVGQGTVVGVAFDLGGEIRTGWAHGTRFVQNVLTYLVKRSLLKPNLIERSPLKPKANEKTSVTPLSR